MGLEGSLKDFGLADILQLIYFQRKTGILNLEGRMDKVKLLFIDGNIVGAESKKRMEDNRLGKILFKKGHLKEEDLKAALSEQKASGAKLGKLLIAKNLVRKDIVHDILKSQLNETVVQIFGWNQGKYEFTAQGVPQDKDFSFSLDTQHLLMEGLRIVDEWSIIKGRLTLDTVFVRKKDNPSNLSEEEKDIFSYLDGENDVSTIVDLSSKDSFYVSNILLMLLEKGHIEAFDKTADITAESQKAEAKDHIIPYAHAIVWGLLSFSLALSIFFAFIFSDRQFGQFSASSSIKHIRFMLEKYRLEHSGYPDNLNAITTKKDPWGNSYTYLTTDNSYILFSSGPDKKDRTNDDIH